MLVAAVQWGTVGEWVGGLAAAFGLVFAGLQIRASTQERRDAEERRTAAERKHREAMARSVSVNAYYHPATDDEIAEHAPWAVGDDPATAGREGSTAGWVWYRMQYRLHNGGDHPIDNVMVVVMDPWAPEAGESDDPQQGSACEIVFGTLAAGATDEDDHIVHFAGEPAFGEFPVLARVLFTDAWGQHWLRGAGLLERRPGPPRIC